MFATKCDGFVIILLLMVYNVIVFGHRHRRKTRAQYTMGIEICKWICSNWYLLSCFTRMNVSDTNKHTVWYGHLKKPVKRTWPGSYCFSFWLYYSNKLKNFKIYASEWKGAAKRTFIIFGFQVECVKFDHFIGLANSIYTFKGIT